MTTTGLTVTGDKELVKILRELPIIARKKVAEPAVLDGARVIRDAAIAIAPRGKTGNLRKGIRARLSRETPLAAVAGSFAPHAHLPEYGTKGTRGTGSPRWKRGKRGMPIGATGDVRAAVGPMPARPYWRPAVHQSSAKAMRVVTEQLGRRAEAIMRRGGK